MANQAGINEHLDLLMIFVLLTGIMKHYLHVVRFITKNWNWKWIIMLNFQISITNEEHGILQRF